MIYQEQIYLAWVWFTVFFPASCWHMMTLSQGTCVGSTYLILVPCLPEFSNFLVNLSSKLMTIGLLNQFQIFAIMLPMSHGPIFCQFISAFKLHMSYFNVYIKKTVFIHLTAISMSNPTACDEHTCLLKCPHLLMYNMHCIAHFYYHGVLALYMRRNSKQLKVFPYYDIDYSLFCWDMWDYHIWCQGRLKLLW